MGSEANESFTVIRGVSSGSRAQALPVTGCGGAALCGPCSWGGGGGGPGRALSAAAHSPERSAARSISAQGPLLPSRMACPAQRLYVALS